MFLNAISSVELPLALAQNLTLRADIKLARHDSWQRASAACRSPTAPSILSLTVSPTLSFLFWQISSMYCLYSCPSALTVLLILNARLRCCSGTFASYSVTRRHLVTVGQKRQCVLKLNWSQTLDRNRLGALWSFSTSSLDFLRTWATCAWTLVGDVYRDTHDLWTLI